MAVVGLADVTVPADLADEIVVPFPFARALRRYRGLKVLFLQDEYENTAATHDAIEKLGIDLVFTCVPQSSIRQVYPEERFGGVRFVPILTGYARQQPNDFMTPERMLGPDVGSTSFPPYLRAFSQFDVGVTLNLRLESLRRDGNRLVATSRDGCRASP